MGTLYDIGQRWQEVEALLETADLDNPDMGMALAEALDNADADTTAKVEGFGKLIKNLEAQAEARAQEARNMAASARTIRNRADWLKGQLKAFMTDCLHTRKMVTPAFTVSVVRNGGKPPLWIEPGLEAADVAREYQLARYDFDKDAIFDALERGIVYLPWARIMDRGERLSFGREAGKEQDND